MRIKKSLKRILFRNSSIYWKKRYCKGGNSGSGSYGHLAEFKAEILNSFVEKHGVESVIEFGCGDGNQLSYSKYEKYLGIDISMRAIEICQKRFKNDPKKKFLLLDDYQFETADLSLSLDVIFHLTEDKTYEQHMHKLFSASKKFVIIYSSNSTHNPSDLAVHVKHRNFTSLVSKNFPGFKLIQMIPNKYPYDGTEGTSVSDFFIYRKIE